MTSKTEYLNQELQQLRDLTDGDTQAACTLLLAERLSNIAMELYQHRTMMTELCRALREIERAIPAK